MVLRYSILDLTKTGACYKSCNMKIVETQAELVSIIVVAHWTRETNRL